MRSQVWNSIVLSLRQSDLLSDIERDDLLFHVLRGEECQSILKLPEGDEYAVWPVMLTSPCFCAAALKGDAAGYPSLQRSLLQAHDLTVWLLRALGIVQDGDVGELQLCLWELGELESSNWRRRTSGMKRYLLQVRRARPLPASCALDLVCPRCPVAAGSVGTLTAWSAGLV